MASRSKRLVMVALAVLPFALAACGDDPPETSLAASASSAASPSEGASEAASTGASSPAPASEAGDEAEATSTPAAGSAVGSTGPGESSDNQADCDDLAEASETISGIKFQQPTLTVEKCTRITVTNNDQTQHTVTFVSGSTPVTGIDLLNPGESKSFVVAEPGSYSFQCNFHPTMKLMVNAS